MRSADPAALKALDTKFQAALKEAVDEENRRWNNRGAVTVSAELVGVRPAGQTSKDSAIVQTALAVSRAPGDPRSRCGEGSTDSNVPMNLGHPRDHHQRRRDRQRRAFAGRVLRHERILAGTQRALLLAVALAR